jgi:hypothetical protein
VRRSTHGNGGTLCRAPRGSAHDKEWSRRTVDLTLCRASSGAAHVKGWSMAHGGLCPLPCVVPFGARQRVVQAPGAPVPLPCVWWRGRTAKKWSMCRAPPQAHDKGTILAALLGQFAVRLPHDARQIDLIFFCFSRPKIPKKHIHDIYITVSITCIIYITTCIIYVTISITSIIYNNIHHKSTPKSEVYRQVHTRATIHRQCT